MASKMTVFLGGSVLGAFLGAAALALLPPGPVVNPATGNADGTGGERPAGTGSATGDIVELRSALAREREAREATVAQLTAAREESARYQQEIAALRGSGDATGAHDPAAAARRSAELDPRIREALGRKDGRAALDLLRQMIALGEPGYAGAIPLILQINEDMEGANTLGISMHDFYPAVGDTDLYLFALHDPSVDARFREFAVWGLPWVSGGAKALETYTSLLATESDPEIVDSILSSMAHIPGDETKSRALIDAYGRAGTGELRHRIVRSLRNTEDAESETFLQSLTQDPDADLAREARFTLTYRNPPVQGFVTTRVFPNTQAAAAGLQRGDILVAYNGTPLDSTEALNQAKQASTPGSVIRVTVYRDSAYLNIEVEATESIGIDGAYREPK
ncbi:MAG: PDZ domain-containing protein [Planctomycetes bacterium]|nr:PDZ domain-containing protein [Planctomycetota bacterium]